MAEHMFVLRPPSLGGMRGWWAPWKCICGVGGTGADDASAERQYERHVLGAWPAYSEWREGLHPFVMPDGETVWVHDD